MSHYFLIDARARPLSLLLALLLALPLLVRPAAAQDAPANGDAAVAAQALEDPMQLVTVDWGQEMMRGGITMIFLALLSVLLLAFMVERLMVLRTSRFVPHTLTREVKPLFLAGQYDAVLAKCRKNDSTLARVIVYLTEHRKAEPMLLAQSAGDLAARDLADQEARNVPFTVIAAMAPLLGLLGTMIGMIEAFKLVEVFGDEGGASMLAGSISKALITTAVGLILALPAIAMYHVFKHRLHAITQTLEQDVDELFSAWFVLDNPASRPVEVLRQSKEAPRVSRSASVAPAAASSNPPAAKPGVQPTLPPRPDVNRSSSRG